MHRPFDPGARDPHIDALLGEVPPALLEERFWYATEFVERYAAELAVEAAAALGLDAHLARGATLDELLAQGGFVAEFRPALASLLARLAAEGEVEAAGEPVRFRGARPLRPSERDELRGIGLARDPQLGAAVALFDAALEVYPAVARGEVSGEAALLAPAKVGLWLAYFDNANPVYALSNSIAAVAAAHRLPRAGSFCVLEVGAGAGSAAEALLAELERRGRLGDVERYVLTEPSPFFRRRAERRLRERFARVPLDSKAVDLDRPLAEQDAGGPYELIFGVNVLHVARRLVATLADLRAALTPGGALVAGECLRLFPRQPVPAEFVFDLLRGFAQVEIDPLVRPHHGFLEIETWRRAFAAAGFDGFATVPDLERIREIYPRFFAGALCARSLGSSRAPCAPALP